MSHAAPIAWSRTESALPPSILVALPWALLGRVAAGVAQVLGLAGVLWLLVALPGMVSARDSTVGPGHGKRPAATMVARR